MEISIFIIKIIVTLLIFAGLAPLFEGFMRKIKAAIHSRQGPPIYQPYIDLFKLLGKEDLRVTNNPLFTLSPLVCFAATLTASLFVPLGFTPALNSSGDMISFVYLITLSSVAVFIAGLVSANPYACIGSSRELMMLFTVEPVLVLTLLVAGIKANTLIMSELATSSFCISMTISALAFFLVIQAQMAKLPFDIVEADQEIMGGPFIEYSGPSLALLKWSYYIKGFIFASLLCRIFINWPNFTATMMPQFLATGLNVIINMVQVLIVLLFIEVIDVVNPRLRVDQSIKYYGSLIFAVICGLTFAFIGS
jgi:formate hydrogenlyase subunit 4